jgi:hypothetical protein
MDLFQIKRHCWVIFMFILTKFLLVPEDVPRVEEQDDDPELR